MDAANKNDKLTNKFDRGGGQKPKKLLAFSEFIGFSAEFYINYMVR